MNINRLHKELGIDSSNYSKENLHKIKKWCCNHITRDRLFTGTAAEQYKNYVLLAKLYLDDFQPYIPENSQELVEQFDGNTVVQSAAILGFDRVLENASLSKSALNQPNAYGLTPLHLAAIEGHVQTVATLLALGADPNIENKQLELPLFSALFTPILSEKGLKQRKAELFIMLANREPESLLHQNDSGNSVLHQIAVQGYSTLIPEVLNRKPQLFSTQNNRSQYPIHVAILNNQAKCVSELLKAKNATSLADSNKRVALHYAAEYGNRTVIDFCCDATDNLNPLDNKSSTPLDLAIKKGNLMAQEALMQHGAKAVSR